MFKKYIFFILFLTILASSCTEKEIVIPKYTPPTTEKAILIEEFTGVQCTNCPNGAKVIKAMEDKYGKLIVSIAIHNTDNFSEPLPSNKYDFRTEAGDKIFKLQSKSALPKPVASFNRVYFKDYAEEDELPIVNTVWQSVLEEELKKPNVTFIDMISEYNSETREVTATVTISPIVDLTGNFNLSVALTENKIIDSQKMPDGSLNTEYEFENVMRDMLTPYDGEPIGSNLKSGDKIVKTFTYTLPESDDLWVAENIDLVAFVTGGEKNNFSPVLNAVKIHLVD